MIKFSILPTKEGFKFAFNSKEDFWFSFDYVAICSGSKMIYGTHKGYYSNSISWYVIATDEPVISVGAISVTISKDQKDLDFNQKHKKNIFGSASQYDASNVESQFNSHRFEGNAYNPYIVNENRNSPYLAEYNPYLQYPLDIDTFDSYLDQYNP